MIMHITRTFDLLDRYKELYQMDDALAGKQNGEWVKYSSEDYIHLSNLVSYGLLALGYKKGDKIATISNNRPEWNFVDMGMAQIGVIHVPIYPTIGTEEYDYIINHSEVKAIIVSSKLIWNKISSVVEKIKSIQSVYSFNDIEELTSWKVIIDEGKKNEDKFKDEVLKNKSRN